MLDTLTREAFVDTGGEALALRIDERWEAAAIVESRNLASPSPRTVPPFAVVLRGPAFPLLAQGIHALRHPRLGELHVFLVPVGRGADGVLYEAVFN